MHSAELAVHFQDNLCIHDARIVAMPACCDGRELKAQTALDEIAAINLKSIVQTVTNNQLVTFAFCYKFDERKTWKCELNI